MKTMRLFVLTVLTVLLSTEVEMEVSAAQQEEKNDNLSPECAKIKDDFVKSATYTKGVVAIGSIVGWYKAIASGLANAGTWLHQAVGTASNIATNKISSDIASKVADANKLLDDSVDIAVKGCQLAQGEDDVFKVIENYELIGKGIVWKLGRDIGKEISKELSVVLTRKFEFEKQISYPNYEIELCYEDCNLLCKADFFEIGWLENPTLAFMNQMHRTLIELFFSGNEFHKEMARVFYNSLTDQILDPTGYKAQRLDELLTFAEHVNSLCLETCQGERRQQFRNGCCSYRTCSNSVEQSTPGFCKWWPNGFEEDGSRQWTSIGPNDCQIEAAKYDLYSYDQGYDEQCFINKKEEKCSMIRQYVAMDGAEYCGAKWTKEYFCLFGPVGYRATLHQNACNENGVQPTNERKGSYCQRLFEDGCITQIDRV